VPLTAKKDLEVHARKEKKRKTAAPPLTLRNGLEKKRKEEDGFPSRKGKSGAFFDVKCLQGKKGRLSRHRRKRRGVGAPVAP